MALIHIFYLTNIIRLRKEILINLLLAFILFSCSSSSHLPSWYTMPKESDNTTLYGVGVGKTQDEASLMALKNLASKLSITISSEITLRAEEKDLEIHEEMIANIKEVVQKISFNNYKITNSKYSNKNIYVEIAVDRASFLDSQKRRLNDLDNKLSRIYKNYLANLDVLERRKYVDQMTALNTEFISINEILRNFNHISETEFNQNYKKTNLYHATCDEFKEKIELFVDFNYTPELIKEIIWSAISKEKNIKLAKKITNNPYTIKVKFDSNVTGTNIYGVVEVHFYSKINALSFDNKPITNRVIEFHGRSDKNKDHAIIEASKELLRIIDSQGIYKVLGI